eukprot:gene4096-5844_t
MSDDLLNKLHKLCLLEKDKNEVYQNIDNEAINQSVKATTVLSNVFLLDRRGKSKSENNDNQEEEEEEKESVDVTKVEKKKKISINEFWQKNTIGDIGSICDDSDKTVFNISNKFLAEIDYVKFVTGFERSVYSTGFLCCVMDERPFNLEKFLKILSLIDGGPDKIITQYVDTSISVSSYCMAEKEKENYYGGKTGECDSVEGKIIYGIKLISSPLYHAVQTNNSEAVRALLKSGADWNECQKIFKLVKSNHSIQDIKKYGENYLKMKTSENVAVNNEPSIVHPAGQKNVSNYPTWSSSESVWEIDTVLQNQALNPFQLAFFNQNKEIFEIFLDFEPVVTMNSLHLTTKFSSWTIWPLKFSRLQYLKSLKIEDPFNTGPIPSVVMTLTSLTNIDVTGSGYTVIADEISNLTNLEVLNVSSLKLNKLPLISMSKLRNLTSVDCSGIKLTSPPPEIVKRGPASVAQYIRDLGDGAEENTDVLLMFIGDGEAGKTSTLLALKNNLNNTARAIGVDDRTIGIDISDFKPFDDCPLRFSAWDFGGQAIYAIMQQLFMSRRAVYPLLWRIRESLDVKRIGAGIRCDLCKKPLVASSPAVQQHVYRVKGQGLCHAGCVSYESLIMSWTERLQFRVPGVTVVLIATHIDCATPEEVDEQCSVVADVVQRIIARQSVLENGIPQLQIYDNGRSLRVNNMNGEGVAALREKLKFIAESLDFYGEVIPSSYAELRRQLRKMQRREDPKSWRTWMTWDEYIQLAAACNVVELEAVNVATRFFHDTGELRYFGEATKEENKAAKELGLTEKRPSHELLANTVFPNPFWIVDVLRGLIRHEQAAALQLVESQLSSKQINVKKANVLRRRIHRLMQRGLLHKDLLPYIWHNIAGLFSDNESNDDEFRRLIALMQAFDILMDKPGSSIGTEWIVPCLCAGRNARTIDSSAFVDDSMPFMCRLVYDALPPFFDMMLVAHVMNFGVADSVDFIGGAASFRKYGEKALVFAGLGKVHDPNSVFRQDQLNEELLKKVLREDQCHVVISSSTRRLLKHLVKEVSMLEEFFPGLRRLSTLFPCYSCRMKKIKQNQELSNLSEAEMNANQQLLLEAEKKDIEQSKVLVNVLGADDPKCDACYYKNSFLGRVWSKNNRLNNMVRWGQWFTGGGSMRAAYNNGRQWGTPRFYEEILWMMLSIVDIEQPTPEIAEKQKYDQFAVDHENAKLAVADRQFEIASHQLAGELPVMQTVSKYCEKNLNSLTLGWKICEKLCEYLGPLDQYISISSNTYSGILHAVSLDRETLVPELLYVLRSVCNSVEEIINEINDEIMKSKYHNYSANVLAKFDYQEYNDYINQNEFLLKYLYEQVSDLNLQNDQHYLIDCYNGKTPACYLEHKIIVNKSIDLFHGTPFDPKDDLQMTEYDSIGPYLCFLNQSSNNSNNDNNNNNSNNNKISDRISWLAIKSFLTQIVKIVNETNTECSSEIEENLLLYTKEISEQFPTIILDDNMSYYDQYRILLDDSNVSDLIDSIWNDGVSRWWGRLYDLELSDHKYRELILLVKYHQNQNGLLLNETIELFQNRFEKLKSIENYKKQKLLDQMKASETKINDLKNNYRNIMIQFHDIPNEWNNFWNKLINTIYDTSNITNNINNRMKVLSSVKDSQDIAYINKVNNLLSNFNDIIQVSKLKSQENKNQQEYLIHYLQENTQLISKLNKISSNIESAYYIYKSLQESENGIATKRLNAFIQIAENRTQDYAELMRLRELYGPVWFFGGGERLYSNREKQKWDVDEWKRFVDTNNKGSVCLSCPAEKGENYGLQKLIVQPADPCAIFISHSNKGLQFAQQLSESICQAGVDVRCVISEEVNNDSRLIALKQAKVFICCMDNIFSSYSKTLEEYFLATSLKLDMVPILLEDYQMGSISSWWPSNMPSFEHHSLFIDMRTASVSNPERTLTLCETYLMPTIRKILSEWSPPLSINSNESNVLLQQLENASGDAADVNNIIISSATNDNNNGTQDNYDIIDNVRIPCDLCSLEGGTRGYYEQAISRRVVNEWKTQELIRRENNPDEPAIAICPLRVDCSGPQPHNKSAVEVLATKIQQDSLPCPRCLSKGILPPFSFIREKCLAELEINRSGSLACKRCNESVPLFELLRSEVFMSYNWGFGVCPDPKCCPSYWQATTPMNMNEICLKCENRYPQSQWKYSNQLLVNDLKKRIEEEAGVTCWHDVDRLVGGKDLVKEMEMGIHYAEVVVIFLSDNYKISKNCQKEYQFATNQGKYIIPVIVRDYTIPDELNENVSKKMKSDIILPEKWYPSSMTSLSQFKPILLLDENQLENVLFEICERIQSRFHRAQRYATVDDAIGFVRDYRLWREYRQAFFSDEKLACLNTSEEIKNHCVNLFEMIDTDGNLVIDVDEMLDFLDKQGIVLTRDQVIALVSEADLDCDEQLTKDEFYLALSTVVEEEKNQSLVIDV